MTVIGVIVALIVAVAAAAAGYFIGYNNRKRPLRPRSAAPRPRLPGW